MKRNSKILAITILLATVAAVLPVVAQVEDHRDIKFPPLPEFEIPEPEVFTLDNGLKVFLMEDHELPLISINARIRTGSNYMPGDREGMDSLFGQVQREGGTASMSGDEIDDFLEARAAFVETGMGGDSASASMNCLVEDFDDVFRIFIDVLRTPQFAEDKIDLARVQLNTSIARRNDSVGGIVGREFRRLIYGADSPLARMMEYETVARITRDDLLAWHKKHYHPNNIYLGVVGDFDSAAMKKKIETALAGWPKGAAFDEGEVAINKEIAAGVFFIEKEDVTQANIRAGHLGIKRDNPDYYAVTVMNEVLGGGFSGRLMQNIRSEKGLAYSVFGGVGSSFMRPGVFQVGMSTKLTTMAESVRALQDEVAGMIANPPTKDEMQQAKESILNSFVFNYTSRSQILSQQMTFAYYGLPTDYLEQYRAGIDKVAAEDVARVAKKYMHPDQMVLLVVGKSEEYDEPVGVFGEAQEIDITIPPPADTRPEVEKSASNVEAGRELLDRMAHKINQGAVEPVQAATSDVTVVVSMGGQSMSLGQKIVFSLPDKVVQTVSTPMGEQKVIINGNAGVVRTGDRTQPVPGDRIEESLQSLYRQPLVIASLAGDPQIEAVAAGADEVDGNACELVAVTLKGAESRLCVDAEGTVLKQTFQGRHPFQGTPGLVEMRYSDYGEFDGRMLPGKQEMVFDGQTVTSMTIDSLEVNPEIDAEWFALPESE